MTEEVIRFVLGMMLFSIEFLRANVSRESTAGPVPADSIIERMVEGARMRAGRVTTDKLESSRVPCGQSAGGPAGVGS